VDSPALQHASAIHYTSDQEREEAESIGVRTRSFVLPIGLEPALFRDENARAAFFEARPELASREIILFLSRIDPKKGLDLLLEALPGIIKKRPEVCLLVAGAGNESYLAELRNKVEELGIANDVIWAGFLEGEEKARVFAAARVFVLPSYSENFGIAAVEALSAGLPSVITAGVGIAKELKQAGAAMVIQPKAPELADAILMILCDKDRSDRLAAAGRAFADQHYSIASMGRGLVEMYRTVLATK
jgi:glycosyltransferase involved in cell wall biosynthesis